MADEVWTGKYKIKYCSTPLVMGRVSVIQLSKLELHVVLFVPRIKRTEPEHSIGWNWCASELGYYDESR